MRGYVICTTPRSGSNFLGQLLESTGKLGRPREYFNGPARRILEDPTFPDEPAKQIERILSDGASGNRVYALKAFPDQWRQASTQVPVAERLPQLRYLRLIRRDTLGQAVSWSIALQTHQYRSTQAAVAAAVYSGRLILECMRGLVLYEADWTTFFARNGLEPLRLFYEDIERDPQGAVERVAEYMDVTEAQLDKARVNLRIQRNAVSEAWRERFLGELGAPEVLGQSIEGLQQRLASIAAALR